MIRDLRRAINAPAQQWPINAVGGAVATVVATPQFSPAANGFVTSQNVTITCSTPSSTIYYTTDGSTPTTGSTLYSSPVAISSTTTLKAIAVAAGLDDSAVATGVYTISDGIAVGATVLTPTTADITISGVEVDNGTFYMVAVLAAATAPSAAQIEAGTDGSDAAAVWDDARSVLDTNDVTVEAFGLSAVAHIVYAVQKDSSGNYTSVVNTGSFTPADVTAPVLSSAEGTKTGTSTADLSVNTDSGEGTLWWVVTQSATTPSVAQIKAGQDHTSTAADDSGSQAVSASGPQTPSATGLTDATEFWAHFVQDDAASNTSDTITSSASFTTDSATILMQVAHDGDETAIDGSLNATLTGNITDPNSATNAIRMTNVTGQTSCTINQLVTFNNGNNKIIVTLKDTTKSTAARWVRIRSTNVTDTSAAHFNVTSGTTGTAGGNTTNLAVADLGGGWYECSYEIDMTGDGDLVGSINIYMADANGDQTIPSGTAGDDVMDVFDWRVEVAA